MSIRSLYLAHPILLRDKLRAWELGFEQRTGIELGNPFYDGVERDDIKAIDAGTRSPWGADLDYESIVRGDVGKIVERDGLLAYVEKGIPSIGTFQEIWITMSLGKPVFIVSPDWGTHPWLVYCATKSGGKIFETLSDFESYVTASVPPDRVLGWVEGLIDGEGCIGLYKPKRSKTKRGFQWEARVAIVNTDKRMLETAMAVIGGHIYPLSIARRQKQCYTLVLSPNEIRMALPKLKLVGKERQRQLLIEAVNLISEHRPQGSPKGVFGGALGSSNQNDTRLEVIWQELRELNKRGRKTITTEDHRCWG